LNKLFRAKNAKTAKEKSLNQPPSSLNEEEIGRIILDSAFKVHNALGPGLLESVYESALAAELKKRSLTVERQKPIPVEYDGQLLDVAFRADLIVNKLVLVELKSVETITPLFKKTVTSYLKLIPLRLGFLINFNETHLKNGIVRVTRGLEGKDFFAHANKPLEVDFRKPSLSSRSSRDIRT
jgi:GxxExxY protein